jgi:superoxide dismutase
MWVVKNKTAMKTLIKFESEPQPYHGDTGEPFINKLTLAFHYYKYQKVFNDNFIYAIKGVGMESIDIMNIYRNINEFSIAAKKHGSDNLNRSFYWKNQETPENVSTTCKISKFIGKTISSDKKFKKQISNKCKAKLCCNWASLSLDEKGILFIDSDPNQINLLMDTIKLA